MRPSTGVEHERQRGFDRGGEDPVRVGRLSEAGTNGECGELIEGGHVGGGPEQGDLVGGDQQHLRTGALRDDEWAVREQAASALGMALRTAELREIGVDDASVLIKRLHRHGPH